MASPRSVFSDCKSRYQDTSCRDSWGGPGCAGIGSRGARLAPIMQREQERPGGIHPVLAGRCSPTAFDASVAVDDRALGLLLEAARWAPSAGNSQPWGASPAGRGSRSTGASSATSPPARPAGHRARACWSSH
ncbi:nitroreductase family protein [Kitasatospora camelliae]|uniref:Nitroreductase family protein n=1 Tax=Kitasatospora camelliae TaxID=3156397 RepID=A0AAU8JPS3_9ACTN